MEKRLPRRGEQRRLTEQLEASSAERALQWQETATVVAR